MMALLLLRITYSEAQHSTTVIYAEILFVKLVSFYSWKHVTLNILFYLQYRSLAPMYYRGASAAIIVYDITREVSVRLYW